MYGSKTKNSEIYTKGYLITTDKHNIFDMSETLGVPLLNDIEKKYYDMVDEMLLLNPPEQVIKPIKKRIKKEIKKESV